MVTLPVLCDGIWVSSWSLQSPASLSALGIFRLHGDLLVVFAAVLPFVSWFIARLAYGFRVGSSPVRLRRGFSVHGVAVEVVWTVLPGVLLALIAVPSFGVLYGLDSFSSGALGVTVHAIGRQWYWAYEVLGELCVDGIASPYAVAFESYMVPESALSFGELRLLEVDSRLVLPVGVGVRFLVSAADVLHCFAIPSFGVKLDGCPGRINEVACQPLRLGTFYGQCSELCGVGHAFMPIVVDVVTVEAYVAWCSR
jgi:heme/copper-type cytochrome/quinol oxidase subunit 2